MFKILCKLNELELELDILKAKYKQNKDPNIKLLIDTKTKLRESIKNSYKLPVEK